MKYYPIGGFYKTSPQIHITETKMLSSLLILLFLKFPTYLLLSLTSRWVETSKCLETSCADGTRVGI